MLRSHFKATRKQPLHLRNVGLLRGLWWIFSLGPVDRLPLERLSSHQLRDIGLDGQSTGDGEEPWKRLK